MEFCLLNYLREKGLPRAGLLVDRKNVIDLELALEAKIGEKERPSTLTSLSVLEDWESFLPKLRRIAKQSIESGSAFVGPLSETRLAAPILYPSNIFCAAANYVSHSKEMGDRPLPDKSQSRPFFFSKLPRQTVIGPGESILIPYPEAKVDWEAEIGVVIGRTCRNVAASEAMKYVAGFTIMNDLSDRARNFRQDWHFKFDWLGGKSFDT